MATLTKHGFLGLFSRASRYDARESNEARRFARRAYKEMGGPTAEMKKAYAALMDNERRSRDG